MGGFEQAGGRGNHAVIQAHQGFSPVAGNSGVRTTGSGTRLSFSTATLARANGTRSGAANHLACWRRTDLPVAGTHKNLFGAVVPGAQATQVVQIRHDCVSLPIGLGAITREIGGSPFSP